MTSTPEYSVADDLALAISLAGEADLVSMHRFGARDLRVEQKPDRTFVTDADRAVERVIREGIAAHRPHDAIYGEEYGVEGDSRRQWIIDPIDGTANFLRGTPLWGTLIALAVDGVPIVGVASVPTQGGRWWGARGLGAFTVKHGGEPTRIHVSGVADLADANVSVNGVKRWDEEGKLPQALEFIRTVWYERGVGDLWPYALLAEGAFDVVTEPTVAPYDVAALIPIVEEAGGRFTGLDGTPGPWVGSALATNGLLHDASVAILGR